MGGVDGGDSRWEAGKEGVVKRVSRDSGGGRSGMRE